MAAVKVGSRDFTPKQWASKRCMAHDTISCMPSDEPGRGLMSSLTAILFPEALNEQGCNHCVPEGNEGTLVTPPIRFLCPLWSTWHVLARWFRELRNEKGVWWVLRPGACGGEEGRYSDVMRMRAPCFREPPQELTCMGDAGCTSACAKKRFPFIISVVPQCGSTDLADSVMTFSPDCS